jgi:aryl-phospho-beta-D-glucosidase BglC (GH1 family)
MKKGTYLFVCLLTVAYLAGGLAGCTRPRHTVPDDPHSVVGRYGWLQVVGNQLCDQDGNPVQLKGIAVMDVTWFREFSNPECLNFLRDDWGLTVFRAVVYTEEDGQHYGSRKLEDTKRAIDAAIEAGVYVIVDWHVLRDEDPLKYKTEAAAFFRELAEEYRGVPNVIYEICNEPNGKQVKWETHVKPYAEEIIPIIRKREKRSLILVGSPTWSQDIDKAADDPLDFGNILYTLHFYAGTHGNEIRSRIKYVLDKGYPVFVTEWGVSRAEGDGGIFRYQSCWWIDYLNENNISWIAWSISNRSETSAALKVTANPRGGWDDGDLTDSGLFLRALIRGETRSVLFADGFETENFTAGYWDRDKTGISKTVARTGSVSARFTGEGGLSRSFSTKDYRNGSLEFQYKTENTAAGDTFRVEWSDGQRWRILAELPPAADWTGGSVDLPGSADDNLRFRFRFVSDLGDGSVVYLDDVRLILERKE